MFFRLLRLIEVKILAGQNVSDIDDDPDRGSYDCLY